MKRRRAGLLVLAVALYSVGLLVPICCLAAPASPASSSREHGCCTQKEDGGCCEEQGGACQVKEAPQGMLGADFELPSLQAAAPFTLEPTPLCAPMVALSEVIAAAHHEVSPLCSLVPWEHAVPPPSRT
ncbi:MAG: hypothetical protein HY319_26740 [Armatimonadetes bacterium]|nr:hypothetical protein [Armatimonadota bacterium]